MKEERITIKSLDGLDLDARLLRQQRSTISVLLVHGFGVDLHEEGTFDVLAERLFENKASVARFSFRGHGASAGTQDGMTISGERLDLSAAYRWMTSCLPGPYSILAASFGAVSTLLQLRALNPKPLRLVLWNPVLDLDAIFVNPVTSWGKKNFGAKALEQAIRQGYSKVDGAFHIGQVFLEEVRLFSGNLGLLNIGELQTLVVHGAKDSYVPISSSRSLAQKHNVRLIEIPHSDHGFPDPESEQIAMRETVPWLT